jgi:hypothetical protein
LGKVQAKVDMGSDIRHLHQSHLTARSTVPKKYNRWRRKRMTPTTGLLFRLEIEEDPPTLVTTAVVPIELSTFFGLD